METIFTKMDNSKINEPHKFVLDLSQILDLRSSDEHIAIQNVSIYCTWKNIRKHYKKKNKLKTTASLCNDEFELPDGLYSASEIHDYKFHIYQIHYKKP